MATLAAGQTVGHYRILGTLGQGGQATAFKAEDVRLNRTVVIKALRPELAESESARKRFEREACLCSALDNPNIQAVYDVGQVDGLYYIVMQYIEGPTLRQLMGGRPLLTLSALSIGIQVADALAVAHSQGIIHRDLKPANVIVTSSGQAKVLDFGLAKMLAVDEPEMSIEPAPIPEKRASANPETEVGVPFGSIGYGSPEQAAGERVDHRSDIFSLGVLLYEMFTGQAPFRGRHAGEVLTAVKHQNPRAVRELNSKAPAGLQPILDRALAKSPSERFQTMAALRDELKALMRQISYQTGLVPTEASATLVPPQRVGSTWLFTGTLGRVFGRLRSGPPGEARSGPGTGLAPARPPSWGNETRPTLAVLPFKNLTGDPHADFFQYALADGVITELAQMRSLIVRPSVYIQPYVGLTPDPRQVAEELGASLVLTGSFLRLDGQLRVSVQVLSAENSEIVWSDRLDTTATDLLRVQDALSDRLIAGLRLRLMADEERESDPPPTIAPEAYEFFLRGRDLLMRYVLRTLDDHDLERAIRLFHESIGLDPNFAGAHAWLGRCYVLHAQGYGGGEYYILAERSLRRALELDEGNVDARLQFVYVHLHHGDKRQARETLDALKAELPQDATVLFVSAMLDRLDGLFERALLQYEQILVLNPRDSVIVTFNKARIFAFQGRYDEALAEVERGRAVEPEHPLLKTFKAVVLFGLGRLDEAQLLIEDVLRAHPQFDGAQPLLGWCLSARGRHEEARALITERVKAVAGADQDVAFWLASFYAMEDLREEALEWVRTAVRLGNENYPLFEHSRKLDNLREDPRFIELMAELKRNWETRTH